MISSAQFRILFIRPTHSNWFRAFSSSVTPSAAFICSMIKSNRSSACSFRSARYVHNSPVRIRELYRAGCSCLRYSWCSQNDVLLVLIWEWKKIDTTHYSPIVFDSFFDRACTDSFFVTPKRFSKISQTRFLHSPLEHFILRIATTSSPKNTEAPIGISQ